MSTCCWLVAVTQARDGLARSTLDAAERKELLKAAEDGLRRCLALDPSDPRTYVVLGKTLLQQRRYDEARQLYQNGCANTGNTNPYIWSAWGWLEAQAGNPDRARKLYDAALVVDGSHACAWHKWGMLEKGQGNYTRARDLWMQGIQRCRRKPQSQNAYLYCALGCMAAQLGRLGEARAWFEEGTRTAEGAASVALWQLVPRRAVVGRTRAAPAVVFVFHAWGSLEYRCGNVSTARELFKAAVRVDPKNETTWATWVAMESELGNVERADELRIRQAEQQWEFVVPPGFTTRPTPGILDTLARFFSVRGFGGGAGAAAPAASAGAAVAGGGGGGGAAAGSGSAAAASPLPIGADDVPLRLQDLERAFESGDMSMLPNFVSEDDDVEASLRRPPRGPTAAGGPPSAAAPTGSTAADGPAPSRPPLPPTPPPLRPDSSRDVDLAPRPVVSRSRRRTANASAGSSAASSMD
ncbi:hypothetical protein GPECTOR_55g299 [Gonium pectorale]|uniref:Uncharacterized protein n=1 Tax=Gonium pectorale TaxID=33097 RepID=A0A150G6J6_GONPE|nr:hypothetical protein GPECTOR_55g299 [Gonium pectorale]|eukprot:KXZ45393.1 hypothetical protein GPECTOR_55g299 [Gonium pectorale]